MQANLETCLIDRGAFATTEPSEQMRVHAMMLPIPSARVPQHYKHIYIYIYIYTINIYIHIYIYYTYIYIYTINKLYIDILYQLYKQLY